MREREYTRKLKLPKVCYSTAKKNSAFKIGVKGSVEAGKPADKEL